MNHNVQARRWTPWLAAALAMLVSACIPEGVRVPQSEFSALLERKVGRIAYLGIDGNIHTIDQGGGDRFQVTDDAFSDESSYRFYGTPVWSPDSQSLAFVAYMGEPGQQTPSQMSLFTAQPGVADSRPVEAITGSEFLVYYNWSPDSQNIGLLSQTPSNSLALRLVPRHGGPAALLDAGSPYYWSWAPDGSAVLAHAGGTAASQARLALLQLGSAEATTAAIEGVPPEALDVIEYGLEIEPAPFKAPAFSPDGSKVLVAGKTEEGQTALLMSDALGNDPQVLAEYTGSIAFVWSPDGKRVAYLESPTTSLGAPGKVTIVDPSGKKKPITLAEDDIYAFFWSPDSQQLAYFVEQPLEAETEADAAEAEGESAEPAEDDALIFGLRVAEASNGRSHQVAQLLSTERFLQVIPYFDQYHQSLTIWSPDSKNLVVSAYRPDGTPGVWVVAASGKLEPRYITEGWMAFWSPK